MGEQNQVIYPLTLWGHYEVLCYKPEGRWFEIRWGEWNFSVYLILSAALGPGGYSAPNRNEYKKQENSVSGQ
jgi:hypothetical protein